MIKVFMQEPVASLFMVLFFTASIIVKTYLGVVYQNMIKEADNMAATNNRLLKQCKLKFANCYQLNNGVANIPVFVEKFMNRMKAGPFSFEVLDHLSGQAMLVSVICAGIGICRAIAASRMLIEILPFYVACFLGLYIFFSVNAVIDLKGKKTVLKVNLVDYLENHLAVRMEVTNDDLAMLYGEDPVLTGSERRRGALGTVSREAGPGRTKVMLFEDGAQQSKARSMEPFYEERSFIRQKEYDSGEYRGETSKVTAEELEVLLKEFLAT